MDKNKLMMEQEDDLEAQSSKEEHRVVSVPSSLCYSTFTAICCCTPLGIAALVMGLLSHDAKARGKYHKAASRARLSRKMSHLAVVFGLIVIALCVAYGVATAILVTQQQQQIMLKQQQQQMQAILDNNIPGGSTVN